MNAIDHSSVGVPDIAVARLFYDPLLATLGITCLAANETLAAYGRGRVEFILILPADCKAQTAGNGVHIAFAAPDRAGVEAFFATALAMGGSGEGAPGVRPAYPMPEVYAAFARDPYGNKLEALHNGFAA